MADVLLREQKGEGITLLTLNRPEAMNCFNFDLLGALVTFGLATFTVRWQVNRHRAHLARLEAARAQVAADPQNPRAYFVGGEHLGTLLLRLDRRREAAEVIDRYARLGGARRHRLGRQAHRSAVPGAGILVPARRSAARASW